MIFIRADANELIGTGHIMRCLPIAHSFKNEGEHVLFVTADHKGDKLLFDQGFETICLDSRWTEMEAELDLFKEQINRYKPSLVLVDSYYVTERYFEELSVLSRLAYIDDMNKGKWEVDFLINYSIYSSVFDYSLYKNSHTRLMLKTQFVPLRKEFKNAPKHEIKGVTDILISAGGADPEKVTERIIDSICPLFPNVKFHFIVGALNPRLEKIRSKTALLDNAYLHINEHHMADLMNKCDVAISAAGSTLYELCAMGIPTITYSLADNQTHATKEFDEMGYMLNAGDCRVNNSFIPDVIRLLNCLISDQEKRGSLSYKMQTLVDGYGSDRIVTYIKESILSDAEFVLRNINTFSSSADGDLVAQGRTELGRNITVCFRENGMQREVLSSNIASVRSLQ